MTSVFCVIATQPFLPWAIDAETAFAVFVAGSLLVLLLRATGRDSWQEGGRPGLGRWSAVPVPVRANSSSNGAGLRGLDSYAENRSPDELDLGRWARSLDKGQGAR